MLPRVQKIAASLKSGLVLSFLLVLASTGTVTAQSAGFFTATGSMTSPRSFHTATLLQDGTVLIAGGTVPALGSSGSTLASAELFDPSTGIFTATGDMTSARHGHTATLLPNGQVLIVGGYGGGNDAPRDADYMSIWICSLFSHPPTQEQHFYFQSGDTLWAQAVRRSATRNA